jgi:type II secretory pathway predicted ATPase ExeA
MTAKSTDTTPLDVALKTLWGASRWPGMAVGNVVMTHPSWQEAYRRLDQLAGVGASGVLHGPNGVGKSTLLHHWSARLNPKQYRFVRLAHSSLLSSDLLRQLVKSGGKEPMYKKGDNVRLLSELWQEWEPAWPILIIEEAQDLAVVVLEELRLLTCARSDAKPSFSLILCGDADLLGRLELNVNRALVSRLGFCLHLAPWPTEGFYEYLHQRLAEVGIHSSPFEPAAETLLLQSAQGIPRTLNALLQRAMEQAALANRRVVTSADVQMALDALPWLARTRPSG